jgi:exonuclease SbcD
MKLLHFADAHIDMANYGRHDPESGLPFRVLDFLKSLDTIIDTAINEKVELVIFAGDAYKDRTPAPTFQREWGKRIMRLSAAKIPTLLLVGNHDLSPSIGRANAIEEFNTLQVPFVRVLANPQLLKSQDLWGLPIQVIAIPWISRSGIMATMNSDNTKISDVYVKIEDKIKGIIYGSDETTTNYFEKIDPSLPVILTAHASVQGATYGAERMVMLGADLVLSGSLVKDSRLDYVALGHIHKAQNLNGPGPDPKDKTQYQHPPVIYPGSIERVDFGEAHDDKFFIVADVEHGKDTKVEWRKLENIRPFVETWLKLESAENVSEQLKAALPGAKKLKDAVVKLTVEYPRDYEKLIDENEIRAYVAETFEFHLVKRPQITLARRGDREYKNITSLTPLELLDVYWRANHIKTVETEVLQKLAAQVLSNENPQAE